MTTTEKVELALIPLAGIAFWFATPMFPNKVNMGTLLLWASAMVLIQSLIRDLWLLHTAKSNMTTTPLRRMRCMCVESTVGVTGIFIGLCLPGVGWNYYVPMSRWEWSFAVMIVMSVAFVIKDFVVEWQPFRIRRDKDHLSIVFMWKK